MVDDRIYDEIKALNESEQFYKEYYNAKKDAKKLREFVNNVDRQYMMERSLWLPEIKHTSANYLTEYFVEDIRKNIEISKHNRYTPLFLHKHAFFEMIYVLSGTCVNTVNGTPIHMKQGDICIIAPDVSHTMGVFDDESIIINIIIRRSTFRDIFEGIFTDDTVLSLFFNRILYSNTTNSYILFPLSDESRVQETLNLLILESIGQKKYYKIVMENLLRTTFCYMLREQEHLIVSNSLTTEHPEIMQILRYMQDNYKTIDLEELAGAFKYSPDYIGKLIKKNTGITFIKILRDIRIKKACNMLLNTNLNVIDICYEVGYGSIEFFNRTFKKLCGMTPTEYRKKHSEFANLTPEQRSIILND